MDSDQLYRASGPQSRSRGIGLFATRDIRAGTRILEERPLFTPKTPTAADIWVSYEALSEAQKEDFGKRPHCGDMPVPWKSEADRRSFETAARREKLLFPAPSSKSEMYAHFVEKHQPEWDRNLDRGSLGGRIAAIFYSNCFEMGAGGSGYFPDAARLNHSCLPNCHHTWNEDLLKLTVHAMKDIKRGEEFTICYLVEHVLLSTFAERRDQIYSNFGFGCVCRACNGMDNVFFEEQEAGRKSLANSRKKLTAQNIPDDEIQKRQIDYNYHVATFMHNARIGTWQKGRAHLRLADYYEQEGEKIVEILRSDIKNTWEEAYADDEERRKEYFRSGWERIIETKHKAIEQARLAYENATTCFGDHVKTREAQAKLVRLNTDLIKASENMSAYA